MPGAVQAGFFLHGPQKGERRMRQVFCRIASAVESSTGHARAVVGSQAGVLIGGDDPFALFTGFGPRRSARYPCGPKASAASRGPCREFEDQVSLFALVDRLAMGLSVLKALAAPQRRAKLLRTYSATGRFLATPRGNGQQLEEQLLGEGVGNCRSLLFGLHKAPRSSKNFARKVNPFSPDKSQPAARLPACVGVCLPCEQLPSALLANPDAREQRRIPILSEQVHLRVVNSHGSHPGVVA